MSHRPLLSVLIPTYKHKEGLARILYFLTDVPSDMVEVLIYDNSPDEESYEYVKIWQTKYPHINLKYNLNRPSNSAPENWNNLLNDAQGEYVLLFHNGEFPATIDFFKQLVNKLESLSPDMAVVRCVLSDSHMHNVRTHMPSWLVGIVLRFFPSYLIHRNAIGPTSAMVAKKDGYSKFDPSLKWLLDVDSYYQTATSSNNILVFSDLAVVSITDKTTTLTNEIKDEIALIERNEKQYIDKKFNHLFWTRNNLNIFEKFVKLVEKVVWVIFVKANILLNKSLYAKKIITDNSLIKTVLEKPW